MRTECFVTSVWKPSQVPDTDYNISNGFTQSNMPEGNANKTKKALKIFSLSIHVGPGPGAETEVPKWLFTRAPKIHNFRPFAVSSNFLASNWCKKVGHLRRAIYELFAQLHIQEIDPKGRFLDCKVGQIHHLPNIFAPFWSAKVGCRRTATIDRAISINVTEQIFYEKSTPALGQIPNFILPFNHGSPGPYKSALIAAPPFLLRGAAIEKWPQ